MAEKDKKRIVRLISILTQLQATKLLTATKLAEKFEVSVRTIYRDLKTLEQAGVPIITEEGKGYTLMEGYRFPPIALTESETNALVTAEKLINRNKDVSFVNAYSDAITKIKAVLRYTIKDKANYLGDRVYFGINQTKERTSNALATIQHALTNHSLLQLEYIDEQNKITTRLIEPFALLHTEENWLLLAFCRLRNEYRFFRLDRIQKINTTNEKFQSHKLSLQDYFQKYYNTTLNP